MDWLTLEEGPFSLNEDPFFPAICSSEHDTGGSALDPPPHETISAGCTSNRIDIDDSGSAYLFPSASTPSPTGTTPLFPESTDHLGLELETSPRIPNTSVLFRSSVARARLKPAVAIRGRLLKATTRYRREALLLSPVPSKNLPTGNSKEPAVPFCTSSSTQQQDESAVIHGHGSPLRMDTAVNTPSLLRIPGDTPKRRQRNMLDALWIKFRMGPYSEASSSALLCNKFVLWDNSIRKKSLRDVFGEYQSVALKEAPTPCTKQVLAKKKNTPDKCSERPMRMPGFIPCEKEAQTSVQPSVVRNFERDISDSSSGYGTVISEIRHPEGHLDHEPSPEILPPEFRLIAIPTDFRSSTDTGTWGYGKLSGGNPASFEIGVRGRKCPSCPFEGFGDKFRQHMEGHFFSRPFKCAHCSFSSNLKTGALSHESCHLAVRRRPGRKSLQKNRRNSDESSKDGRSMAFDFLDAHFFDQPVVHDNYTSSEALEANATVTKKRKSRQSQPRDTVRSLNHDETEVPAKKRKPSRTATPAVRGKDSSAAAMVYSICDMLKGSSSTKSWLDQAPVSPEWNGDADSEEALGASTGDRDDFSGLSSDEYDPEKANFGMGPISDDSEDDMPEDLSGKFLGVRLDVPGWDNE